MSNPEKNDRQKSPESQGLDTGLKVAFFFVVAFRWVGYHPWLSIFLAAIAGVCAGCIACWWQITDEPEHNPPEVKKKTLAYQTKRSEATRNKTGLGRNKP